MGVRSKKRGLFVTLEGPEGSGKTTLAKEIYQYLRSKKHTVLLTYEPGGSSLGRVLRKALLDHHHKKMSAWAELFLFEADRAQHVAETIRPALAQGKIVLCCRYGDSTVAYQGYGRGLDVDLIKSLNHKATGNLVPHLTLLLDVLPELGLPRAFRARGKKDRLESEDLGFHRRLRQGFLELARKDRRRFRTIAADQDFAAVREQAFTYVDELLSREL